MPDPTDQPDGIALVEHSARYASEFGVEAMLDLIAGVHQAYARITNDPNIKLASELAGIPLQ